MLSDVAEAALRVTYAPLHRFLAAVATRTMFQLVVLGADEAVGPCEPVLLACTHQNMGMDGGIMFAATPRGRALNFWVKATVFRLAPMGIVMRAIGCVPVSRREDVPRSPLRLEPDKPNATAASSTSSSLSSSSSSSSSSSTSPLPVKLVPVCNASLWATTVHELQRGACFVIFPEGTSYTLPHLVTFREGLAKAALDFAATRGTEGLPPAKIVPVGITYLQRSEFRSVAIVTYGAPIDMSGPAGSLAPGELTRLVERRVLDVTINAPDWATLHAARMAFRLLARDARCLNAASYVPLMQAYVTVFTALAGDERVAPVRALCLKYREALRAVPTRDTAVTELFAVGAEDADAFVVAAARAARAALRVLAYGSLTAPVMLTCAPTILLSLWLRARERYDESRAQCLGVPIMLFGLPSVAGAVMVLGKWLGSHLLGIAIGALLVTLAYAVFDELVDAWIQTRAMVNLAFFATREQRAALIALRKDTVSALRELFFSCDSNDGFELPLLLRRYDAGARPFPPAASFRKELSLPPGTKAQLADGRHIVEPSGMKLPTPTLLETAQALRHICDAPKLEGKEKSAATGGILRKNAQVLVAHEYIMSASGRE